MNSSATASFDREYQALQSGRAVVELPGWSSISVTGADRQVFLQNFCTNDVKRLVPGTNCEAFFTNVKGKIVGHGVVDCRDEELAFVGAPGQGERLVEHLDRYVIREDVTLRDTTGERNFVFVTGDSRHDNRPTSISWNITGRDDTRLIELGAGEVPDFVHGLTADGFVVAGPEAFTAARVEAAMPQFGVDFDEQNLPQEVGRDREAISFTKGCYLGQETVARIDAIGHVNQRIVAVRFHGGEVPTPGTVLTHGDRNVGVVSSAVFSPKFKSPIALAMVRREANSPGTGLGSPIGDCEVTQL